MSALPMFKWFPSANRCPILGKLPGRLWGPKPFIIHHSAFCIPWRLFPPGLWSVVSSQWSAFRFIIHHSTFCIPLIYGLNPVRTSVRIKMRLSIYRGAVR